MAKKAHFIGICGVGMSATALLLKEAGWGVTGSDEAFYPPGSECLARGGISFTKGYRKKNIPADAELIVIGRNAKLTPEKNVEVAAAYASGVSIRSFPEVLQGLFGDKKTIVVAGSSGKSTCTALAAWCLLSAGKKPGFFIGAAPIGMEANAALGKDDLFVIEGDEYPASHWDDSSKFLYYSPHDLLLTSAAHDHLNIFPTHEVYLAPFQKLIALLPGNGILVASVADDGVRKIASQTKNRLIPYASGTGALWHADEAVYGEGASFNLMRGDELVLRMQTPLLGRHNVENIVGVSALLLEKKLLSPRELGAGVATFRGLKRRLELLTKGSSVRMYEGFGSSYEKARAAIEALRLHFPKRRLIVLFEPHAFSWRGKKALRWYDTVFAGSDKVFVASPESRGKDGHEQLSHDEVVARVKQSGTHARAIHSAHHAMEMLGAELAETDVVLMLTSGAFWGLAEKLPRFIEERFPKKNAAS